MTNIFQGTSVRNKNIFMAMTEDVFEEEAFVPPVEELPPPVDLTPPSDPPEVELVISLIPSLDSLLPRPSS
jgi:hypothetical protein